MPDTIPTPSRPDISSSVAEGVPLPDGLYFGFLRGADAAARTVEFDLAESFIGAPAHSAETEDGADDLDGYVRNPSSATRTLAVASDVIVTRVGCCVYEGAPGTFEELAESFGPGAPANPNYGDPYRGPNGNYWLTIEGSIVVRIDEAYQS